MYKNILAAVSLFDNGAKAIIKQAQSLLDDDGLIHVLYVLDTRYLQYVFDPVFSGQANEEIASEAAEKASAKLRALCSPLGIPAESVDVLLGHPATLIRETAEVEECDLIVMGTHGRRGLRRLLGSVANDVLHGTPTNVLLCRSALPAPE